MHDAGRVGADIPICSEPEPQSDAETERVAVEKSVCQTRVDGLVHHSGIGIELRGKLVIDGQ